MLVNRKNRYKCLYITPLEVGKGMRNGKGMAYKTINHAAFSVLQRWQNYTRFAPFV